MHSHSRPHALVQFFCLLVFGVIFDLQNVNGALDWEEMYFAPGQQHGREVPGFDSNFANIEDKKPRLIEFHFTDGEDTPVRMYNNGCDKYRSQVHEIVIDTEKDLEKIIANAGKISKYSIRRQQMYDTAAAEVSRTTQECVYQFPARTEEQKEEERRGHSDRYFVVTKHRYKKFAAVIIKIPAFTPQHLEIPSLTQSQVNDYFSDNYDDARRKFIRKSREYIELTGGSYETQMIHIPITETGPGRGRGRSTVVEADTAADTAADAEPLLHVSRRGSRRGSERESSDLSIDVTTINPESTSTDHMIIYFSGTHGVEGPAGSAIELAILDDIMNEIKKKRDPSLSSSSQQPRQSIQERILAAGPAADGDHGQHSPPIEVLVHSVNPFGQKYNERTNENRVDLNRNYKTEEQWLAFAAFRASDGGYEEFDNLFNPRYSWPVNLPRVQSHVKFFKSVVPRLSPRRGTAMIGDVSDRIANAYIVGQSHDPQKLSYVGRPNTLEPSHRELQSVLNRLFEQHPHWIEQLKKISFVDIHTGLGEKNWCTMIIDDKISRDAFSAQIAPFPQLQSVQGGFSIKEEEGMLDGAYENANGYAQEHINRLVANQWGSRPKPNTLLITQEFGTVSKGAVMRGVIKLNSFKNEYEIYGSTRRPNQKKLERIAANLESARNTMKEIFNPDDNEWRQAIVRAGLVLHEHLHKHRV